MVLEGAAWRIPAEQLCHSVWQGCGPLGVECEANPASWSRPWTLPPSVLNYAAGTVSRRKTLSATEAGMRSVL
jgi:hypothetical protein